MRRVACGAPPVTGWRGGARRRTVEGNLWIGSAGGELLYAELSQVPSAYSAQSAPVASQGVLCGEKSSESHFHWISGHSLQ